MTDPQATAQPRSDDIFQRVIDEGRKIGLREAAKIARWHQIELRPGVCVIDADALVAAIEAKAGEK